MLSRFALLGTSKRLSFFLFLAQQSFHQTQLYKKGIELFDILSHLTVKAYYREVTSTIGLNKKRMIITKRNLFFVINLTLRLARSQRHEHLSYKLISTAIFILWRTYFYHFSISLFLWKSLNKEMKVGDNEEKIYFVGKV